MISFKKKEKDQNRLFSKLNFLHCKKNNYGALGFLD